MTYANVNGQDLYYEIHGTGRPLVVLHGGALTIDLTFGAMLPTLAATRQVIGVELQGHGHTADTDRDVTLPNLAGDVVALLDHLGIDRADLFGYSLGGLVALQIAMTHPDRVDHLVAACTHYRSSGYYPEILAADPTSTRMPTEQDFQLWHATYRQVAPDPGHFFDFLAKVSAVPSSVDEWQLDDLRGITAPTLLMIGDTDFMTVEHAVAMRHLIPGSQLAVLPGTTHMGLIRRTELVLPIVETFLP